MKGDAIETFGQSLVQYGPENDRVFLMKLAEEDLPEIITSIDSLAVLHSFSKAFVKVPETARGQFAEHGYQIEAKVPGLFKGREDGLFMARYFDSNRLVDEDADRVRKVLDAADVRAERKPPSELPEGCHCRLASPAQCRQMAELYQQVFESYPFPIDDPEYLASVMAKNVIFAGIWHGRQLVALASAEVDHPNRHAELTDFATDPEWRGQGLASHLLRYLEDQLRGLQIETGFTIARGTSYGMNVCFAQNGYQFAGTLVKNTQIGGQLESMNVWYKRLKGDNGA